MSQDWPAQNSEFWPIEKITPYARNSRTHSDEQVAQIAAGRVAVCLHLRLLGLDQAADFQADLFGLKKTELLVGGWLCGVRGRHHSDRVRGSQRTKRSETRRRHGVPV